jgi:hypothetical protein
MAANQLTGGNKDGYVFGQSATDLVSFYGKTPIVQPTAAAQAAVTDSSGGTASAASGVAAAAFKQTILIPVGNLADLANSQTFKVAVPFAFTLTGIGLRVGKAVTTGSKAATLTAQINGVAATGGVISLTSANATPAGALVAGTAVTAANVGTAGQTLEVAISGVTAFTEGTGWVEATVSNNDLANVAATIIAQGNAKRTALVNLGLIKGA